MKFRIVHKGLALIMIVLIAGLVLAGTALADGQSQRSSAPVYWSWDFESGNITYPVGTSTLVRTANGVSGTYTTDVLTPGNAATLWFIVFNYPEECIAGPYMCSPHDLGDTAAQGDFFLGGGHVLGAGNFAGHLQIGDRSGSGLAEVMGCQDCTPGLIDPEGALVVLAIHDHGWSQTGETLAEQIGSFLGGCDGPFNGNEFGFATGFQDIPDNYGECSTIQFSPHMP
jgi:hypothetical protein